MARRPVALSPDQAFTALAFIESFENHTTGAWRAVEQGMRDDFAIPDPEAALDDLRDALQS